ncbi:Qat anti-phage system QueC-like protein QatC [Novosphingobium lindaniclasticum]
MRHHTIVCRLGAADVAPLTPSRSDTHVTEVSFVDGERRLGFGLGDTLDHLARLGIAPSERSIDLALLAAAVTAADTRISRTTESQDLWTREIDVHVPVSDIRRWTGLAALISRTLNFLTGDHWSLSFRRRPEGLESLAPSPTMLRQVNSDCVCLFSGGLDSFIGAIDLLQDNRRPMLVSHYWDGITSSRQTHCAEALKTYFPDRPFDHVRGRIGFPNGLVTGSRGEDTLRARSFLFFALAAMAADAIGGDMVVHVPENGLISLNVPIEPSRLGALSTRTTHPWYMARVCELLAGLGLTVRLYNRYRFKTKGMMAKECRAQDLLMAEAMHTMSCSSPAKARYARNKADRTPKHCGHCVPCLIRRAAIVEAFATDDTPYQVPSLTDHVLNSAKAEGNHVRGFQVAFARMRRKPGRARFDIHRPGPLTDHPDDLAEYEKVYVEGMKEVQRLLAGVKAWPT